MDKECIKFHLFFQVRVIVFFTNDSFLL